MRSKKSWAHMTPLWCVAGFMSWSIYWDQLMATLHGLYLEVLFRHTLSCSSLQRCASGDPTNTLHGLISPHSPLNYNNLWFTRETLGKILTSVSSLTYLSAESPLPDINMRRKRRQPLPHHSQMSRHGYRRPQTYRVQLYDSSGGLM